ncbi:uncharacterized protein LOC144910600 [Branchiostoma floridae x Branchiostoma belcheri]
MVLLYTYGTVLQGVLVPGACRLQLVCRMLHYRRCFLTSICSLRCYNTVQLQQTQTLCLKKPVTLLHKQRFSSQSFLRKDRDSSLWTVWHNDGIKWSSKHDQQSLLMPSPCKYSGVTHEGRQTQKEDTDTQTTEELVSSVLSRIEETKNVPQKSPDLRDSALFWAGRLLEIGCTQKQVYHFITTNSQLLNSPDEKVKGVFTLFLYLDISKNKVMDLISTYPEILREQPADLKRKVQSLQKHVASVENVAKVVLKCPQVLTLPLSKVRGVVAVLKDNCQFKSAQVQTILTTTPAVLLDSPEHAELLFQYAFFAMGATREDMVRAFLFRHTWDHIRSRHMFLERRGMYQPPDKKGKTKDPNPPLRDILATTTKDFLTQVAFASYEEYATFVALLEQEEETDTDTSDMSSSDESEDTDEETDGDEETTER